jgi:hypothetical protein
VSVRATPTAPNDRSADCDFELGTVVLLLVKVAVVQAEVLAAAGSGSTRITQLAGAEHVRSIVLNFGRTLAPCPWCPFIYLWGTHTFLLHKGIYLIRLFFFFFFFF